MMGRRWWIATAVAGLLLASASVSAQDQSVESEPLTLEAALVRAQGASQSLERARLDIDIARAEVVQARASLWPQIGANLGLAYVGNPSEGVSIPAGAFGALLDPDTFQPILDPSTGQPILIPRTPVEVFPDQKNLGISATLELDQPIFTSGKLRAGVNAAIAAVDVSAAQREVDIRQLRRQVTLAYTGVTAARESAAVVEEIVRVLVDRVADAEQQYAAGATTRVDVLSAKSRQASARLELVRARQARSTAEANLAWLIGTDPSAIEELEAVELPDELPSEVELVERARAGHPMLDELRMTANRAEVGVDGAAAAGVLRPDIGLRVKAEVVGQTIPFVEDDWKESWDANLTISIGTSATIFDGNAASGRREAAEGRLAQARSAITEFSESIPLQIRSSLEQYLVARAMLEEAGAQLAAAEERARVAHVSFENELITRSDVLGARLAVLEAQLSAIGARAEGAGALAEIEYLAGSYRKTD